MTVHEFVLLALCGLGTFLLRYLPLYILSWQTGQRKAVSVFVVRILQGVGPAAIAALLVVSFMPMLNPQQPTQLVAALLGATTVYWVKRLTSSLALAVSISALVYGALMHIS